MSKLERLLHSKKTGVALVELVISLVFLVPLMLLTIEFSHALYEYQTIVKQVRAGARYLTTQPMAVAGAKSQPYWDKAKCLVRSSTLGINCKYATPVLANLTDNLIYISDSQVNNPLDKLFAQPTDLNQKESTTVNLIKVSVEGYVHQFLKGMPSISFPPIVVIMRQQS